LTSKKRSSGLQDGKKDKKNTKKVPYPVSRDKKNLKKVLQVPDFEKKDEKNLQKVPYPVSRAKKNLKKVLQVPKNDFFYEKIVQNCPKIVKNWPKIPKNPPKSTPGHPKNRLIRLQERKSRKNRVFFQKSATATYYSVFLEKIQKNGFIHLPNEKLRKFSKKTTFSRYPLNTAPKKMFFFCKFYKKSKKMALSTYEMKNDKKIFCQKSPFFHFVSG